MTEYIASKTHSNTLLSIHLFDEIQMDFINLCGLIFKIVSCMFSFNKRVNVRLHLASTSLSLVNLYVVIYGYACNKLICSSNML